MTGLYAGLESALFGIGVTNFVYYYWYEWSRALFEKAAVKAGRASKRLTTVESILAGAIAGQRDRHHHESHLGRQHAADGAQGGGERSGPARP